MQKTLAEIFDLRRYRDNLYKKIKKYLPKRLQAHAPSFTHLTAEQIHYLDNMDEMRSAATKYACGTLQEADAEQIQNLKQHLKMEMLDLSIRNERVALLDEITRAHAVLNHVGTKKYPDARFIYSNTQNSYTPYVNTLKNEFV